MRRLAYVLPFLALAASVALMHSSPAGGHTAPTSMEAQAVEHMACCAAPPLTDLLSPAGEMPQPGQHGNALLHLCLAVLSGLVLLLSVASHRFARPGEHEPGRGRTRALSVARPPPRPAGRHLIALVCVLRQ